jgi:hypothetical protein
MITPYYVDDIVQLFHGDFRDLLPELLLKHSFDLTIADPPYSLCLWCARPIHGTLEPTTGTRCAVPCGHPLPALGEMELHRIDLPYPDYPTYPALSLNARGNRWATNRDVQAVRADVSRLARPIRPGKHLLVHLAWSPQKHAGKDQDNLGLLYKVICDALARGPRRPTLRNPGVAIGLDLVPDDTPKFVTKLAPVILPPGEPPGMVLTVGVIR